MEKNDDFMVLEGTEKEDEGKSKAGRTVPRGKKPKQPMKTEDQLVEAVLALYKTNQKGFMQR